MNILKRYAWYGSAVAASFAVAMALLFAGTPTPAHAAGTVSVASPQTINLSANKATGIADTFVTLTPAPAIAFAATDITAANDVRFILPAGFEFDQTAVATASKTGGGGLVVATNLIYDSGLVARVNVTTDSDTATGTITATGLKVRALTANTATADIGASIDGTTTPIGSQNFGTLTVAVNAGNFIVGGSAIGATSTASKTGSTIVQVTAQGPGVTSATFQTSAGTWAANNTATLFCNDQNSSCDVETTKANVVQAALILPASGTATITVTPNTGTASTITVTLTAASVLTSVSLGTTTNPAIPAATSNATPASFTITLLNQSGTGYTTATNVTVSTNLGIIDSSDGGTTCDTSGTLARVAGISDSSCTISNVGVAQTVEVYGNDVTGTATVTITATSAGVTVSGTKTITFTGGTPTSLTLDLVSSMSATSTPADSIIRDIQVTTTGDTTTDEIIAVGRALDAGGNAIIPTASGNITFKVTDSAGVAVALVTATSNTEDSTIQTTSCSVSVTTAIGTCVDAIEAAAGLAKNGAVALLDNDAASTAPLAHGVYTVTATWTNGTTTLTATKTFSVAGAASTITVAGPTTTVAVGGSGAATITVKDADGKPVADGTTVTLATSSAVAAIQDPVSGAIITTTTTLGGNATINLLGLSSGTGQVFAIAGGKTGSATFTVGAATPPPAPVGDGTFASTLKFDVASKQALGVFTGTVAQLDVAITAAGGLGAWGQDSTGKWVVYIVNGGFVNDAFKAAFPNGFTGSPLVVIGK